MKTLLSHNELVLAARKDLSELITDENDERLDSFQTPFTEDPPETYDALGTLMDALKSGRQGEVSQKAFVILDERTAEDGNTCQVAVDGRNEEDSNEIQVAFRCELSSATHGLAAVEESTNSQLTKVIRDIRNEAAMVGGLWNKQRVDELRSRPKRIDVDDYPPHENWDDTCGPEDPDTDIPYYPIFMTADISLKVSSRAVLAQHELTR